MQDTEADRAEVRKGFFEYPGYWKYITLADAWGAMKDFLFIVAFLLAVTFGGDRLLSWIGDKLGMTWESIPGRVYVFIAFAVIYWFLRGAEIRVPRSRGLWLSVVLFYGALMLVSFWLPLWATLFVWLGSATILIWAIVLAELGEQNYRKLHAEQDDNIGTF